MLFDKTTISGLADENGAPSDKLIAKYEHLAKSSSTYKRKPNA